ncbi:unnamed protein product [Effrenium voratum]|uniref:Uncharacterized protein n=1 Tax=Effrenium voratum TaxID=2562239 RepID=A0AA36ICB8_9DINO|nr:unnamed protein product [Effrenium voratum]
MGCCGSTDKDTAERLAAVEQEIKASRTPEVEDAARFAKELRVVFDTVAEKGGDMRMIAKVEDLSDSVVRGLINRIDLQLVQKGSAEYQPIVDRIMVVATDLDAVRATKATKLVDAHLQRLVEQQTSAQEKQVDPLLKKLQAVREKVRGDAKLLIPGTKEMLDVAEQAHAAAPEAKPVAKGLLEQLVPHSVFVLESEAAWCSAQGCEAVIKHAERTDLLAGKLVAVLGAVWEPAITPQVESVRQRRGREACAQLVAQAERHIEADEGGEAYGCLQQLLPWWPVLKSSHSLEIVGLFSKMQSYANQAFLAAANAGNTETAEEIRGFAVQFDSLRAQFEGLPPSAGRALGEVLESGEAKIQVAKALDTVEKELAKTTDDDDSTNLSLGNAIQALESLKVAWPVASKEEPPESLVERIKKTMAALESWTFEAMQGAASAEQVQSLMQFAQEYDRRRIEEFKSEPLRPRLTSEAAMKYLKRAESELLKSEGMKPQVLLESLKAAAEAVPGESGSAEARSLMLRVMTLTNERLLKAYAEAISAQAENEKKEIMLMKFAESADEVRQSCVIPGTALVEEMSQKRVEVADELIEAIRDQITAGQLSSLGQDICILSRVCKKLPTDAPQQKNAKAVASRYMDSLSSLDAQVDESTLQSAAELQEALKTLGCDPGDLKAKILEKVSRQVLGRARTEKDLEALGRHLDALVKPCQDESLAADLYEEIQSFANSLEDTLLTRLLEEGRAQGAAAVNAAEAADRLRAAKTASGASGALKTPFAERVAGAQKAVGLLEEANAELAKTAGMNPKAVVNVLKELAGALAGLNGFYDEALRAVLERFREKLAEAAGKALQAEGEMRDKKLAALAALAKDADSAQQALASLPGSSLELQSFAGAVSGARSAQSLEQVELELGKESGMNPKLLLQGFQELGRLWPTLDESLQERCRENCSKVRARMGESLDEALSSGNAAKQKALLSFAKEFDACGEMSGALEAELQSKLDAAAV